MHNADVQLYKPGKTDDEEILAESDRLVVAALKSKQKNRALRQGETTIEAISLAYLGDNPQKKLKFRHETWPDGKHIRYNQSLRDFEFVQVITPGSNKVEALDFEVQPYYGWYRYTSVEFWRDILNFMPKRGF